MDLYSVKNGIKIRDTYSVCPDCLERIPAAFVKTEGMGIVMNKTCPRHGSFAVPVWKDTGSFEDWISRETPFSEEIAAECDGNCRNCTKHLQETCCVILEVTGACNLRCRYCFACGGEKSETHSTESLRADIDRIVRLAGEPLLQFAGGEPTLRDDLPGLVRYAKEAGCSYTQINTNGIRLAEDEVYVRELAEAGLDIVFLQFDGTDDETYRILRGRDLLDVKRRAIHNCDKYHIGITLVPTIVRGINDQQIGGLIRTAVHLFPAVQGIHFQPVTYLGRYPHDEVRRDAGWMTERSPGRQENCYTEDRYTMDELMQALTDQTGIPENALLPSRCDHAACEFHATFIVDKEKRLIPVSNRAADNRTDRTTAQKNRQYVAQHWKRSEYGGKNAYKEEGEQILFGKTDDLDFDTFIRYMKTSVLKISAMAFQDAMNLDLERLGRCSLHVYENGKLLPFCGKYLTALT